jgi:hypothetical protein
MNKEYFITGLKYVLGLLHWILGEMEKKDLFNTIKVVNVQKVANRLEDAIEEMEDAKAINLQEQED